MKIHNPPAQALHHQLTGLLAAMRENRGFDAQAILEAKAERLNAYMGASGLSACVVGVSGGLDSAVVLLLCARAVALPGSPIKRVVPLLMPVMHASTTNQAPALHKGRAVCQVAGIQPAEADLTRAHAELAHAVEKATGLPGGAWAKGQLVSYARTPAVCYVTSLLTDAGLPALSVGTTNRDEGAYLGYVGKFSDGAVDLQLISDLHKSEVRALGELLGVPQEIMDAAPSGDMFDGRTDEEVFGAPYDFTELYLNWLCLDPVDQQYALFGLSAAALAQFQQLAGHLERLHGYNAHKYLVGSPSVHLDLLPSAVPGGWDVPAWQPAGHPAGQPAGQPAEQAHAQEHAQAQGVGA